MKKSMNESPSPLNHSPLAGDGEEITKAPPSTADRIEWGKLFFNEGGFSLFIIFPLTMLYYLAMAAELI